MKNAIMAAAAFVLFTSCADVRIMARQKNNLGFFGGDNPYIQYFGRWDFSKPSAPKAGWGAVYVRFNFTGTSLSIALGKESGGMIEQANFYNYYQYSIDNGKFKDLVYSPGKEVYLLEDRLAPGSHSAVIVRCSEANFGVTEFLGVGLSPQGEMVEPDPAPVRKIEVIGDSISTGLANKNSGMYIPLTQDGNMAFGPQLARLLGAQWRVEAKGGAYTRVPGWNRDFCMPLLFPRTFQQQEAPLWNFRPWQPDVLVIALGTNDFSDTVGEDDLFERDYLDFLDFVRKQYPAAEIFCVGPWKEGVPWDNCRRHIKNAVRRFGDKKTHAIDPVAGGAWLVFPGDYVIGDKYHPNIAGNTKIAERLAAVIKPIMGW